MFAESKKFERTNVCQLWKNKTFLKATGIACFLSVASQATGWYHQFFTQKLQKQANKIGNIHSCGKGISDVVCNQTLFTLYCGETHTFFHK